MRQPKIIPVIHHLNKLTTHSEIQKAIDCKADGVFLISHHGGDRELLSIAIDAQQNNPTFRFGINMLSSSPLDAVALAAKGGIQMVWGDDVGVDSSGLNALGLEIATLHEALQEEVPAITVEIFAGVAFKYRIYELQPAEAARQAFKAGFIPTTSGIATGMAPDLGKIVAMSNATNGVLAVASGITPENVAQYAPYLSHILVATGIAIDEYTMDSEKLHLLIENSKQATTIAPVKTTLERFLEINNQ